MFCLIIHKPHLHNEAGTSARLRHLSLVYSAYDSIRAELLVRGGDNATHYFSQERKSCSHLSKAILWSRLWARLSMPASSLPVLKLTPISRRYGLLVPSWRQVNGDSMTLCILKPDALTKQPSHDPNAYRDPLNLPTCTHCLLALRSKPLRAVSCLLSCLSIASLWRSNSNPLTHSQNHWPTPHQRWFL